MLKTHDDFPILIALDRQLPLNDETDKKFIKFSDSRNFDSDIRRLHNAINLQQLFKNG